MSLRLRWTLALVALCLVQAGLVAAFVSVRSEAALEQFVYEQTRSDFIDEVEWHVRTTGSLEGFRPSSSESRGPGLGPNGRPALHDRPALRDAEPPLARPVDRRRSERSDALPEAPPPPERRLPPPLPTVRWGLVDASGRTVIRYGPTPAGTRLSADQLEGGTPVVVDGDTLGRVLPPLRVPESFAFPPDSPGSHYAKAIQSALLWGLGLALGLAIVLGVVLASRAVRPLRDLTDAAGRIADGEREAQVEVRSSDEIGQLAATFNAMSARIAEANALRERMTADIAHDLRTPLTAIMGTLEAVQDGSLPLTTARIQAALGEAMRMSRLVDDLHTLALMDAQELPVYPEVLDPAEVLRHVAQSYEAAIRSAGLELAVEAQGAPRLRADPDRLVQALGNLIGNAIRHTPEGGRITLRAWGEGGEVGLAVADTGEGIPPDVLPIVFERSVRADAARSGTGSGLGLSIVRSLVEAMGGRVEAASSLGEGTTMTLWLPCAPASRQP